MKPFMTIWRARTVLALLLATGPLAAWALPPPPPNDDPENAEPVGPLPAVIYGTTVLANNSISSTTLPPPADDVDGPDVFYSFTPEVSGSYRVQLIPWQYAPLRSSDRRFTIYILDGGTALAGARAPGDARLVHFDVALVAGTEYLIAVDYNATTHDNFDFTLIVDALALTNPDTCGVAETLAGPLPLARLNRIDGAANDYQFTQGTGLCEIAGTTPTPAAGNDHVYKFIPDADGDYAIELATDAFDGVLYVNSECGPTGTCLAASNHGTGTTSGGRHELVVVTLTAGVECYIYVDNASTTALTGPYALIIDAAAAYGLTEVEPNNSAGSATPLGTPNGGQLSGATDADWWAVSGLTGDRVYAWVNNGGTSNSTLDTDLALLAADGSTLIEFDDEDADGADAPIEDLRYIYSTSAGVLAGTRLTSDGTHYLRVTDTTATGTVHRYRLHTGRIAAERAPVGECEPNDDLASADRSAKHYYAGVIDTLDDRDVYAIKALEGDRVFLAVDGDPERDANGFDPANTDPNAFHAKVVVYDPAGDVLISDISDANNSTAAPDYPAQAGFFVARTEGTYWIEIGPQSSSSQVGPTETYELAVFINDAAPVLVEENEPLLTLTPDYENDRVAGLATDTAPGDSAVCNVILVGDTNLQITNLGSLPSPAVAFDVELVDPAQSGFGKVIAVDCAGNTACAVVQIDVRPPVCSGSTFARRTLRSLHEPVFIPDNEPGGPGINSTLTLGEAATITDVNVTVTFETTSVPDLDVFLIAPGGASVELFTDRGSSSAFNVRSATFDDSATELMPLLSSDEPYTGAWLPESPLSALNGGTTLGDWTLNARDDSSSENGGSRLVGWTLELQGSFAGPQEIAAVASDAGGFDSGIASIELLDGVNVTLNLPPGFEPGAASVAYSVTLIDTNQNGSGTVLVTDLQGNTCTLPVSLAGLPDTTGPTSVGVVNRVRRIVQEVQAGVPSADPLGISTVLSVPDDFRVGEVEAELTIDTRDLGRLAATLSKDGALASLVNRVGMEERQSVGLTKNTIAIYLDDDAPAADDAHLEPALGTIPFIGLHQPDGRGEFIGDGITTDRRDNLLFALGGLEAAGDWTLFVGDFRLQGTTRSELRRWALILKSPCGPEHYAGRATDLDPGSGIASLTLASGATNLALLTDFTPGAEIVDYRVELVDPTQPGSGTVEIRDVAGNTTLVPVSLAAASADQELPVVGGTVDLVSDTFNGTAADTGGIAEVALAPYGENLQLVSVTPDPPNGATEVTFTVGLVTPGQNGRGYVRVTDSCGWRSYALVEIDATPPACGGSVGTTKRYVSTHPPLAIPDNNPGGANSTIVIADTDVIADVDLTLNIRHGFDDDLDVTLLTPQTLALFSDIGNTGNDFWDTVLDDEAPAPLPDSESEAPFTGKYQPEGGAILWALDNQPAAGSWTLRVADDAVNNFGVLHAWAVTITSPTFPERYDGRVAEPEALATGVCAIELVGAVNLTLTVDPFVGGDTIVRYSVDLTDARFVGHGTVRVSDCAGNTCEAPVLLAGQYPVGDMDCDGAVTFADINPFVLALTNPAGYALLFPHCSVTQADVNLDGAAGFADINPFVALFTPAP